MLTYKRSAISGLWAMVAILAAFAATMSLAPAAGASTHPDCQSADSDPDGDGWGWENTRSCRVVVEQPTQGTPLCPAQGNENPGWAFDADRNRLVNFDWDTDGDGWGWHNGQSCKVQFPRAVNADLVATTLSEMQRASGQAGPPSEIQVQIAEVFVAAFGDTPELLRMWRGDAGRVEWLPSSSSIWGRNTCHDYKWFDKNPGRMRLNEGTGTSTWIHEMAHVFDCSHDFPSVDGDGTPSGMSGTVLSAFKNARTELFAEYRDTNQPPAGLRHYSFTNAKEFLADSTMIFLTRDAAHYPNRIRMAEEAPELYDALRSYYKKDRWPVAADVR